MCLQGNAYNFQGNSIKQEENKGKTEAGGVTPTGQEKLGRESGQNTLWVKWALDTRLEVL